MVGGRKYPDKQIEWVLDSIITGKKPEDIIAEFQKKFNSPHFGKPQFKYLRNTYGDHPDFGCRLLNGVVSNTPAEIAAALERLNKTQRLQKMFNPGQARAQPAMDPLSDFADFDGNPIVPAAQVAPAENPEFNFADGEHGQGVENGRAVNDNNNAEFLDFSQFNGFKNEPENFSFEEFLAQDQVGQEVMANLQPAEGNFGPSFWNDYELEEPQGPSGDTTNNEADNTFENGPLPFTMDQPKPESVAPEAPMLEFPTGAVEECFPDPDHAMVDNQTGLPPNRPAGCTEALRSGWDMQGWWYRGKHDQCAIPVTHRHDTAGQLVFAGYQDVVNLVDGLDAYREARDRSVRGDMHADTVGDAMMEE